MVVCLERGADLHMAQLMPLPLTVSCFSKGSSSQHTSQSSAVRLTGLYEGDEGLQVASGLDGPGTQLCVPVQPGASAASDHRVRLHQQDGERLGGEAAAENTRQGARVVHRSDADRGDHHVSHTTSAAAQTGRILTVFIDPLHSRQTQTVRQNTTNKYN